MVPKDPPKPEPKEPVPKNTKGSAHNKTINIYVDDIVSGIYGSINLKMKKHHMIYNLGNSKPESLLEFIKLIEKNLRMKAKKNFLPLQPGDVPATFADISESIKDLKFVPKIKISEGIPRFIEWFKKYYKLL